MMKKLNLIGLILVAFVIAGYGNTKEISEKPLIEVELLENSKYDSIDIVSTKGIEMVDELGEDGVTMVKKIYKWYSGVGKDKEKSAAIMKAEKSAYHNISNRLQMALSHNIPKRTVGPTEVDNAINSYWSAFSKKIVDEYEPYGKAKIEYKDSTKEYVVSRKIAIEGNKFYKMLNEAGAYRPESLQGDDLQEFIDINNAIIRWIKQD